MRSDVIVVASPSDSMRYLHGNGKIRRASDCVKAGLHNGIIDRESPKDRRGVRRMQEDVARVTGSQSKLATYNVIFLRKGQPCSLLSPPRLH